MSESVTAHIAPGHASTKEGVPVVPAVDPHLIALVREHHGFVWRVLRRFGLGPADADDAAQQVFIVLSHRVAGVPAAKARAFLFRTAMHVAAKANRSRRRRPEDVSEDCGEREDLAPGADELLDRRRARELLDRVLSEMSHDLRAVIVLFELEGLTMSEIA